MKNLLAKLDTAIKRRRMMIYHDDPDVNERILSIRNRSKRWRILKQIALVIYMITPFFEKPGWCMYSSEIDRDTDAGYWHCQNE